jgi:AcrR family transcriptional regulator
MASSPKAAVRATRPAGQDTRASLLDAASRLFAAEGEGGVSIARIADAADCFPSQVRYYFGDKDGLIVETGRRDMLEVCKAVECAALEASTPEEAVRGIAEAALSGRVVSFVEAMLIVRRRPELRPSVDATLDELYQLSENSIARSLRERGWTAGSIPYQVRMFWTSVFGVTLSMPQPGTVRDAKRAPGAISLLLGFIDAPLG